MVRALVAAFALGGLFAGAACGAITPAAAPSRTGQASINVTGSLARGPAQTCPSDEPCDPLPSASMLIFSRAGHPDVTARLDASGSFALHLDPGGYSISAAPPAFGGRVEPRQVRVPETGVVRLQLAIVRPQI